MVFIGITVSLPSPSSARRDGPRPRPPRLLTVVAADSSVNALDAFLFPLPLDPLCEESPSVLPSAGLCVRRVEVVPERVPAIVVRDPALVPTDNAGEARELVALRE